MGEGGGVALFNQFAWPPSCFSLATGLKLEVDLRIEEANFTSSKYTLEYDGTGQKRELIVTTFGAVKISPRT